ncbi:MAG: nitronate monooxygenase [Pseudomonadota bacterium]
MKSDPPLARAQAFCAAYDLRLPILMAPMAGACPPALAIAVAQAGGMGACGALLMDQATIEGWASDVRSATNGAFMLNTWIPDPAPARNPAHEADVRAFLAQWGPEVPADAADAPGLDFDAQCQAMLAAGPHVISSIMGLYPPDFVAQMKAQGTRWFATVTTVAEARAAEAAGADAIIAQGAEAGGHRGAFRAEDAEAAMVGLFALLPAIADAVDVPVIAAGGIGDARGVAAALMLGASAVVIGTALLRSPEAGTAPAWAGALEGLAPEDTRPTRAFSGRLGRAVRSAYVEAAARADTPDPAPYPIQRALTGPMRAEATREGRADTMQAWAGQAAALARDAPAAEIVTTLWDDAQTLLAARDVR